MALRFAFAGIRHSHILDVYKRVSGSSDMAIAAVCEEDAVAAEPILRQGGIGVTHGDYLAMLDAVDCDVVAVGDYYGKRGALVIEALERGKHVLSDKPLCTSLDEFDTIKRMAADRRLQVGLMLDLRDDGRYIKAHELVRNGAIGEVQSIYIGGQHALNLANRPHWYFEPGKHGGTINDIAIHGFDIIEWITGSRFDKTISARTWNAYVPSYPDFHDGAQFACRLENGCGVIGDVSYFAPNNLGGSKFDPSWRITLWGRDGALETSHATPVKLWRNGQPVEILDDPAGDPGGYLTSFANSVAGKDASLDTEQSLRAAEVSLRVQKAADDSLYNAPI